MLGRIETFYDIEERHRAETEQDAPGEEDPENHPNAQDEEQSHQWKRPVIDHDFHVKVWNTIIASRDVIVGDNRPGRCDMTLDEALAFPEEPVEEKPTTGPGVKGRSREEPKPDPVDENGDIIVFQPRLHVAQDRLWHILTGHGVDKAKLPFSEWQLLLCIVAAGKNGILQADAGKQTGQDKRSVPRRTDFLFQKGYIEKRQVLARSQKTSLLTHKIFLEDDKIPEDLPNPSKLSASVLTQDLKPVPGHEHWTGAFVDTEMVARTALAVIRAWGVIRRTHILAKMNITDLRLRKTLERTLRKFFEVKIAKRVSAILPDNPKIFKDCVKFLREPTEEEWAHFKKRLTSQGFKNRPSRAKPKSEHKPRVRKRASTAAKKGKGKRAVVEDTSEEEVEEEVEESDVNDDFFSDDDDDADADETFDASAKPTLMTSTKPSKEELQKMVEQGIDAIPGVDGVAEEDLLLELDGASVEEVHALFEPLENASPTADEIQRIQLVREGIQKARQDTYQYYTVADFKARVEAGDSSWEGVDVSRSAPGSSAPVEELETPAPQPVGTEGTPGVDISSRAETPNRSFIGSMAPPDTPHEPPLEKSSIESSAAKPASSKKRNPLPSRRSKQQFSTPQASSKLEGARIDLNPAAHSPPPATPVPSRPESNESPFAASVKHSSVRASSRRASKIAAARTTQAYQSPYDQSADQGNGNPGDEIVVQSSAMEGGSQTGSPKKDGDGDVIMVDEEPSTAEEEEAALTPEKQLELDEKINAAADEIFPDQAAKIAVLKDGVAGNLCVDKDSTRIIFFPLDIMDMDSKIDMNASLIKEAIADMERFKLIIKHIDPGHQRGIANGAGTADSQPMMAETLKMMIFSFASTSTSIAKNIRSKIMWGIAARALKAKREAVPKWTIPNPEGGPKPFKCDTCGNTYKNLEGIKYHKLKSKTTCNATYVPPPPGQERKRGHRKGYVDVDELPPDDPARVAARIEQQTQPEKPASEEPATQDGEKSTRRPARKREPKSFRGMDVSVRERSRSQESDYREPRSSKSPKKVKKVSRVTTKKTRPDVTAAANNTTLEATPAAKKRTPDVATPAKATVTDGTTTAKKPFHKVAAAQDMPMSAATPEKRVLLATKAKLKYPTSNDRDNVERRTGQVVTQQRKDIIWELVNANGGAFPGDQGLWYAMHASWMEKYPHSHVQDYKYCNQAVTLLEDQGLVTRLKFSFRDLRGRMRTRSVITKMGIDPMGPEVVAVKEKIKESFPRYYCPPEYAPSMETMIMLEGRESRPSEEERQRRQLEKEEMENKGSKARQTKGVQAPEEARVVPNASEVVQTPKSTGGARRRRESSSDDEIAFLDAPFYHPEPGPEPDSHPPVNTIAKQKPKSDKPYLRSATFREGASFRMKALWASIKERGSSLKVIGTNEDVYVADQALIIEESHDEEDDETKTTDAVFINSSPALMQSADGTWSTEAKRSNAPSAASRTRASLPETITYMQQPGNSAWSHRPFGHGVNPIYAKPSKQLPRQPLASNTDSEFRPIIILSKRLVKEREAQPESKQGTKRARSFQINFVEDGPKKRARRIQYPAPEGGVFAYGYDDNGKEVPWPDFKPMLLPVNRGTRISSVMPTWSTNPGLGSLLAHTAATSQISPKLRRPSKPISEGSLAADGDDVIMAEAEEPVDLFSRSAASLKERLAKAVGNILALTKDTERGNVAPDEDTLIHEIDTVCAWERTTMGKNLLLAGSIEPGTVFINHTPEVAVANASVPLIWSEGNHFTLETLPYQLLAYDPAESFYPKVQKPKRTYTKKAKAPHPASVFHGMQEATASDFEEVQSYNSRKRRLQDTYGNGEPRTKRVYRRAAQSKDFKVRRLTCLPSDVEGLRLPEKDPNFAIQISHHDITGHRKRTNERNVVSDALDDRLLVSVIVIRTLLGGLDQSIDWVLVSKLFPQCTMNWLHRHFNLLADKNVKRVEKLVEDFQDLYIKAYEAGELPPLDYDNALNYEWDDLIDWTMDRTQELATANVNLPGNREAFNKAFRIHDTEERVYRDSYFNSALPVHKRIAHATAKNATLPLSPPPEAALSAKGDMHRIARSWARASTLTPEASFNPGTTAAKLHSINRNIMGDAIGQLLDGKVLTPLNKGRPVPGRGFEMTEAWTMAFTRLLSRAHFEEAATFKRKLDDAFRVGIYVTLEYTASEGEIMAATNLQAHGRTIQLGRNVPNNKFGLTDGNYQTRHMDKTKLLFNIDITPSARYIYDSDHPLHTSGVLDVKSHPPPKPLDEAIPLWYDINGELIRGLWRKVVALVLSVIMNRTGADTKEVTRLCKPVLEEWEVKLFIEWARNIGVVKEIGPETGIEGWTVTEWWWWIGGQI